MSVIHIIKNNTDFGYVTIACDDDSPMGTQMYPQTIFIEY